MHLIGEWSTQVYAFSDARLWYKYWNTTTKHQNDVDETPHQYAKNGKFLYNLVICIFASHPFRRSFVHVRRLANQLHRIGNWIHLTPPHHPTFEHCEVCRHSRWSACGSARAVHYWHPPVPPSTAPTERACATNNTLAHCWQTIAQRSA